MSTTASGELVVANSSNGDSGGLSTGAIIGMAVGIPVGTIALASVAAFASFKFFGKPAFLKKIFGKGRGGGSGGNVQAMYNGDYPTYKPAGNGPDSLDPYRGWTTNVQPMTQINHAPPKAPAQTKVSVVNSISEAVQNQALSAAQQQITADPFQTANAANTATGQPTGNQAAPGQQAGGQQAPATTGFEQQFTLDQLSPSQLQQFGLDQLPIDQLQNMHLDNLSLDQLQQLDFDLSNFDPSSNNTNNGPDIDIDRDDIEKIRRYIQKLRARIERERRRTQERYEAMRAQEYEARQSRYD
ncbi:hypothetical protein D0Z03_002961 [Geotrichum reessii]|nr:hypothetical protein D0Z03_002961 [Galactomyces reessii]